MGNNSARHQVSPLRVSSLLFGCFIVLFCSVFSGLLPDARAQEQSTVSANVVGREEGSLEIDLWFLGKWSGTVYDPWETRTYPANLEFKFTPKFYGDNLSYLSSIGTSEYPTEGCRGELIYYNQHNGRTTIGERTTTGLCSGRVFYLIQKSPNSFEHNQDGPAANTLFIRTAACDNPDLQTEYNNFDPNFHHYVFDTEICRMSAEVNPNSNYSCTKQKVFDLMLSALIYVAPARFFSLPNHAEKVESCKVYPLQGIFEPNYITTVIDRERFTVTNITMPGHSFYPGKVVRSVREVEGKIYIRTEGDGVSAHRDLNLEIGPELFKALDEFFKANREFGKLSEDLDSIGEELSGTSLLTRIQISRSRRIALGRIIRTSVKALLKQIGTYQAAASEIKKADRATFGITLAHRNYVNNQKTKLSNFQKSMAGRVLSVAQLKSSIKRLQRIIKYQ